MANTKLYSIFEPTICPSETILREYATGKLSRQQNFKIEKHAVNCEMCSDLIDGYSIISDKKRLNIIENELNEKIDEKIYYRKKRRNFSWLSSKLAIASTVILLIGSALFLNYSIDNNSEKYFAEHFKPIQTNELSKKNAIIEEENILEEKTSKAENDVLPDTVTSVVEKTEKKDALPSELENEAVDNIEEIIDLENEEDEVAANNDDLLEETVIEDISDNFNEGENKSEELNLTLTKKSKKSDSQQRAKTDAITTITQPSRALKEDASAAGATSTTVDCEIALDEYSAENYEASVEYFRKCLQANPHNTQALLFISISYLSLDDSKKAIRNLKKLLTIPIDAKLRVTTNWYLALAYLKHGKKRKAKKILQIIIGSDSEYKKRAKKLLNDL